MSYLLVAQKMITMFVTKKNMNVRTNGDMRKCGCFFLLLLQQNKTFSDE